MTVPSCSIFFELVHKEMVRGWGRIGILMGCIIAAFSIWPTCLPLSNMGWAFIKTRFWVFGRLICICFEVIILAVFISVNDGFVAINIFRKISVYKKSGQSYL